MEYKIIKINEKEYPKKLKKIYAPPQELYVLGNSEILNENSIAIVGCRNCSTYGANMAKSLDMNYQKKE